MMVCYFCCSYLLKPGSVVEKGNWGRIERIIGINSVEQTFELIRTTEFRNRPSRLTCIFLCPTAQSARNFLSVTNRRLELIYEVELVNPDAKVFEADWTLIQKEDVLDTEAKREEAARRYWQSGIVDLNKKEILADSDVRIIRRLNKYSFRRDPALR